jgi:KTSC domain
VCSGRKGTGRAVALANKMARIAFAIMRGMTTYSGTVASETVNVKYSGPVNLAVHMPIARSSFIQRVCYDASNSYMLINLNGTWYHYCEIGPGMVSSLLAAESMGRFYNVSIKGNFDCWTHRVPDYQ